MTDTAPMQENGNKGKDQSRNRAVAGLLLAVVTILLYLPVAHYPFIHYDDHLYVTGIPQIRQGLTWESVKWALTTLETGFWEPLTWLSHVLAGELFGLNPGGHHMMNVWLHAANVFLLLWVLHEMTGALWCSAFVAAMFALHPLNVESVAWITERKNVLSTLLWMTTLGVYVGYVRKPGWVRYAGLMGVFILGLMAKLMLVTLPCVLLLLDYWPLGRMGEGWREMRRRLPGLVMEKVPMLIPAVMVSILTVKAVSDVGALSPLTAFPMGIRAQNAVLSYGLYLKKMVWPMDLAIFYPHPGTSLGVWSVLLSGGVLLFITGVVWWRRESSRYLLVGWLWYLGTAVPAIGLVQVGVQSMADRYAYVPLIGVFIMVVWGTVEITRHTPLGTKRLAAAGVCMMGVFAMITGTQLGYWRNTSTLFEHALQITSNNHIAHNVMGLEFMDRKEFDTAEEHFLEALGIHPEFAQAHNNFGLLLLETGRSEEALDHFSKALQREPNLPEAHNNLGILALERGELDRAVDFFSRAVEASRNFVEAHNNLGFTWLRKGKMDQAIHSFSRAIEVNPHDVKAYSNMGSALMEQRRFQEAASWYGRAVEMAPDYYDARNNLGVLLMEVGQLEAAIGQLSVALRLDPNNGEGYANLGLALAKAGRMEEAEQMLSEGIRVSPGFAPSHYYLALVETHRGQREEAIALYREALRLDPGYEAAREKLEGLLSGKETRP